MNASKGKSRGVGETDHFVMFLDVYGLINECVKREEQRRWGNGSGCYVSRCLWPAIASARTSWLLNLDKASLRLVIGLITGR